ICVTFVTHVYETVFLIREREDDRLRVARLERAGALAQLDALRSQVDPHFLFNSLNTLNWLIDSDPVRAGRFTETLARIYRYMLKQRAHETVPLRDELDFTEDYLSLLSLRFGAALELRRDGF